MNILYLNKFKSVKNKIIFMTGFSVLFLIIILITYTSISLLNIATEEAKKEALDRNSSLSHKRSYTGRAG